LQGQEISQRIRDTAAAGLLKPEAGGARARGRNENRFSIGTQTKGKLVLCDEPHKLLKNSREGRGGRHSNSRTGLANEKRGLSARGHVLDTFGQGKGGTEPWGAPGCAGGACLVS